jgi:P63C domain
MSTEDSKEVIRASMGGKARALKLSKENLSASGKKAAEARWGSELPQATHDGPLPIGDVVLIAANLANGKRLLSQGTFLQAIGRSRTPKAGTGGFSNVDGLPFFLQAEALSPFISEELRLSTTPILFRLKNGQRTVGYDAGLLTGVCRVYQKLHQSLTERMHGKDQRDSAQAKRTYGQYKHIMGHFADRGIEALVDDATGFQADRARDEALKIVEQYVSPSYLIPWTRRFQHDFFRQAYKILGWEYKPGAVKHPQYLGKFILKYVYDPLPPGVLEELKRKLPKNEHGNRRAKLWQALTPDTGIPHLDRQLTAVTTIMELSDGKEEFKDNFDKLFGKQKHLPFGGKTLELTGDPIS